MTDLPLHGRVAVVTGANHGIGAAVAVELAGLGADVLVAYLRLTPRAGSALPSGYDEQRARTADDIVERIDQAGRRSVAVEADLADPASAVRLFDEAERRLGPVSVLVHNASGWRQDTFSGRPADRFGRPMEPVSAETLAPQFDVDARAGALLIGELSRRLRDRGERWGRIVTLSSGGAGGFPHEVSYGAAKAALESFTMSAAAELADLGVTANIVHPPITDTGWVSDDVRRFAADAGGAVASPASVAAVVAWLCTDAAGLVTGNRLVLR